MAIKARTIKAKNVAGFLVSNYPARRFEYDVSSILQKGDFVYINPGEPEGRLLPRFVGRSRVP